MPAVEEVFRVRDCVVPIELEQPCRAGGAGPSATAPGLATTGQEGGHPVSAPWGLGACTHTSCVRHIVVQHKP